MAVARVQAEILADAAAALLEDGVEAGAIAVALERVQQAHPRRGRPFQLAALQSKLVLDLGADIDPVVDDVPVEDDVVGAGQRQRLALDVADRAVGDAAGGEGALHDGEADQHHQQHEAAEQGGGGEVVGDRAVDREGGGADPDHQQQPGRDEHDRALDAMGGEIDHQDEADGGDGGERNAGDARRDRRVVDGQADEREQEGQPDAGDMRGADVPAAEVEIGEQEDHQGGRQHGFGAGAPDPVGVGLGAEDLGPEAEIDRDIGQHRPGERRRRREDDRALDDEDDGQEQGEQAGDADHDALVERQPRGLVLVGFGLPEIELRQFRRLQLGHIGHGGAGIERQPEHVGVGRIFLFRRDALARGDFGNALGAEVRPDHAGADEPEMRGDEQALDLFVGVVGQREHDPGRMGAGLAGVDLDAADDAVRAGRRGNLDAVALVGIILDPVREVDRLRIRRHAHGFDGPRRTGSGERGEKRQQQQEGYTEQAHVTLGGDRLTAKG